MIKLNKRWSLDSDENCVTVYEMRINKKTKEEYQSPRYFYPNFEAALHGLIDRDIQSQNAKSFEYLIQRINDLKGEVSKTLSQVLTK